jgi:hypothetical protein
VRHNGYRCPACGEKDKMGQHVMLCELRRRIKEAESAYTVPVDEDIITGLPPQMIKRERTDDEDNPFALACGSILYAYARTWYRR